LEQVPKTRKFHEIADDSEEDEEEEEEEDEEDDEEDDEEEVLPRARIDRKVIHHPPCAQCQKARRACEKSPNGGSCLPCKGKKYKCKYAKSEPGGVKRGRITKEDYKEDEGSEEEVAPPPAKKRATKKKAEPA
jgi:hypothetical protein